MKSKHAAGNWEGTGADEAAVGKRGEEAVASGPGDDAPEVAARRVPKSAERLPRLVRFLLQAMPEGAPPLSLRQLASITGYSKTKVLRVRDKLRASDKSPAELLVMSAGALHGEFNGRPPERLILPDYATVERRLKEPGQTLRRLWREYRQPLGRKAVGYEQFTRRFKRFRGSRTVSMRQHHIPGMQVCVDFSGDRPYYYDRRTRMRLDAELFVGSLRASCYSFARVVASQSIPDWLDCARRMLEFFGGVPRIHVCDNLKSAVTVPGRVPTIQGDYLAHGAHYGTAILPARVRQPQDKSTVELEIKHVQQHLLPELAKQKFYSLDELNEEITRLMVEYNARPFTERPGSREGQFLREEKPVLLPLPPTPFVHYVRETRRKVPADYHVLVSGRHYSVPHRYVGCEAEGRTSVTRVQLWIDGACVAEHERGEEGGCTTDPEHQTEAHRAQALRTPEEVTLWAQRVGPSMVEVMAAQFRRHKVPLQGLQAAFALQDLGKKATFSELEAAAKDALALATLTPSDLKRLLHDGAGRPSKAAAQEGTPARAAESLALPRRRQRPAARARATAAVPARAVRP
jgi:transposase